MYLLDSDVVIDIQRGHRPAIDWFTSLEEVPLLPGFVAMELVQDVASLKHVRAVLKLIAPLPLVWPSEAECNQAFSDFLLYHHSDGLGLLDSLIAACATGLDATLCTFNQRHYAMIPGLHTEQPYDR